MACLHSSYGSVYKALDKRDGKLVAIKVRVVFFYFPVLAGYAVCVVCSEVCICVCFRVQFACANDVGSSEVCVRAICIRTAVYLTRPVCDWHGRRCWKSRRIHWPFRRKSTSSPSVIANTLLPIKAPLRRMDTYGFVWCRYSPYCRMSAGASCTALHCTALH